jgi:hypothetical protein
MYEAQGEEGHAEKFERPSYCVECDPRDGAESGLTVEDIRKYPAENRKSFFVTVNGKRGSLVDVERANVIEPEDVVGMPVGQQHGIETLDPRAKSLLPKIGRGVYDRVLPVSREEKRRPRPVVVGILRTAHAAVAAESGHAHRSA